MSTSRQHRRPPKARPSTAHARKPVSLSEFRHMTPAQQAEHLRKFGKTR